MQPLKLPEFSYRVEDNRIFCLVRKKWVALIPEEWVRQHFLNLLITHLNYPKGLIRLEYHISYFKNVKRPDILILKKEGDVHLLVECKSPSIKLGQKVIQQVSEYNKVLDAKYLAITNGINHYVWERKNDKLNQITELPSYEENKDQTSG